MLAKFSWAIFETVTILLIYLDHENICKTVGGPSDNVPCVFPFKFRGDIHNECNWDGDASDGAWCSTLIDDSGQHVGGKGNWGNCGPKCPIPPNSKEESPRKESLKKGIFFSINICMKYILKN